MTKLATAPLLMLCVAIAASGGTVLLMSSLTGRPEVDAVHADADYTGEFSATLSRLTDVIARLEVNTSRGDYSQSNAPEIIRAELVPVSESVSEIKKAIRRLEVAARTAAGLSDDRQSLAPLFVDPPKRNVEGLQAFRNLLESHSQRALDQVMFRAPDRILSTFGSPEHIDVAGDVRHWMYDTDSDGAADLRLTFADGIVVGVYDESRSR